MKATIDHTGKHMLHVSKPDLSYIDKARSRLEMAARHFEFPQEWINSLRALCKRIERQAIPDEVSDEPVATSQEPLA